jgi:hypothetical protein
MNRILSYEEFLGLVQKMRIAQKSYFKNRTIDDLSTAKKLEAVVDAFMVTMNEPTPTLFEEEVV